MKLAGGNTFTGAQTGTLANYEAFKLTGSGTNQMYFNLTPGKDFRAGDNFSYINVDSSAVSLFANSGTNYATFYAYPAGNIFSRADKGFVLDGDVVINTGHKLGWNSVASSTYPTPTANSEYVTKGWTDLTYLKKGGVGWADVTSKPFNSIGDGLAVTDGVLSATGGGGATTWEQVSGKPFNGVGWGLDVVGNNIVSAVTWDKLLEKPFKTVGDGLNISDEGVLVTSWSWLPGKPFSYIGSGLSVAVPSGALIAIPAWTAVTSKPFNSIGSGLSVEVPSGALTATPAWTAVTSKPFSYIGSGLTVEVPSGELTATPAWTAVTSKPFNSIGDGLSVTGGVLSVKPNTYLQYNTSTDQTPLQIKQTVDSYQKLFLMQENEIELVSTNVGQHSESYVILQPHRLVLGCGIPDCMIVVRSTGITVDGPLVTTSTSTTAPASNEFITKEYADGRYALKNGGADKSTGSLHDILQDVAIAVLSLLLGRKKIASAFRNFRGRQ
ncbi:MAG: hypothetical protein LBT73_03095, partial [Tannerellaceae bacterium]|jgi:hypothetical protein|nr:hypothetical protein [Tannerellaceae bacterium]